MPIETMEQFLYTFLTKKYGLKVSVITFEKIHVESYFVMGCNNNKLSKGVYEVRLRCCPFCQVSKK